MVTPPGAGVGPSPGSVEAEKKVEASEMLQALSLLQRIMSPEDFVKYQVLVAPPKPGKTREQELADRVKSLQRLRTQETTHRGQIDRLELDLQRHKDMLQGVLSRIRVESEECDELRAQVAKEKAPPADSGETVPPTQSDSQPDEMYLSTVEEESGDESMLMGGSTGAEDEMDVSRDNGIWERRRNAIIKNKRMVKLKDKDKLRNKTCKTIIIEEEKPPAPPDSGKHLAEVIARLSQDEIGVVLGHLPSSTLCRVGCNLLIRYNLWKYLLGSLLKSVGSGCSREVLKTLKSEVARSFSVVSPLRCDPNRGQRRERDAAASPRCDPMRGQRGKQKSDVDFNDAGKNIDRNSVAGRGRCFVSFWNGFDNGFFCACFDGDSEQCVFESRGCWLWCWDVQDFFWEGFVEDTEQCVFESCCFCSGRCAAPSWIRFAKGFSVECFDDDSEWCVFESWFFWTWC